MSLIVYQESVLHRLAGKKSSYATLDWLLNEPNRIDINLQNGAGESALMVALEAENLQAAGLLIGSGSDLFVLNKFRETALHIAARKNQVDVLKLMLVSKVCPLNFQDLDGNTPLHCAASRGFLQAVRMLVAVENTLVNLTNAWGETPLHLAVEGGFADIVRILVSHSQCDLEVRNSRFFSATDIVTTFQRKESLQRELLGILSSAMNDRTFSEGTSSSGEFSDSF